MRRKTVAVQIGDICISSEHPVLIQSMLNISTLDTEACVEQAVRIIEAGGELVRITAQGVKEAENLQNIHAALRTKGYRTPLSADIHFTPGAARVAARYVEKVRINPGNFVDKRAVFKHLEYTDEAYARELEYLEETFIDFLDVCRKYHTAIRIGTNHGSLSDRIMSRYGNTPAGMVEATLEYLRICKEIDFNNVVISLKSSDCQVMVDAVRLLVTRMDEEGIGYPLHLGVTEAGEGEDGRIRSAVGIGTLLNEGLGDTIRVSLTEAPEAEIPVAKTLVALCRPDYRQQGIPQKGHYNKPVIVADISSLPVVDETVSEQLGFRMGTVGDPVYGDLLYAGEKAPEMIYTEALGPELTKLSDKITIIVDVENIDMAHIYNRKACPLMTAEQYLELTSAVSTSAVFVRISNVHEVVPDLVSALKNDEHAVVVLEPEEVNYHFYRQLLRQLTDIGVANKIIIKTKTNGTDTSQISLLVAAHTGGLFLDRLVYGIWISTPDITDPGYPLELSRNILQSAGLRRYKAEFVSCPGCGRTLYDLEGTVAKVKREFAHLSSLKIAVMGCIVNGPGEMGDADYGYVGAGNGKVNLYKGKQMVKAAVPEEEAIIVLKQLLADYDDWKEA